MKDSSNISPPTAVEFGGLISQQKIEDERLASINRELLEAKSEVQRLRDILDDAGIPYQKQRGLFQGNLRK